MTDADLADAGVHVATTVPLTPQLLEDLRKEGVHKGTLDGAGLIYRPDADRELIDMNRLVTEFPAQERKSASDRQAAR